MCIYIVNVTKTFNEVQVALSYGERRTKVDESLTRTQCFILNSMSLHPDKKYITSLQQHAIMSKLYTYKHVYISMESQKHRHTLENIIHPNN